MNINEMSADEIAEFLIVTFDACELEEFLKSLAERSMEQAHELSVESYSTAMQACAESLFDAQAAWATRN